jgi:hypothetical protein
MLAPDRVFAMSSVARCCCCAVLVLLLGSAALVRGVPAQSVAGPDTLSPATYGTGAGLVVQLTNSGFGLGGYYSRALDANTSFWASLSLGPGKDERELKLFNRFGGGFIPDKRNYLLMIPVELGAQRRLFRDSIEDNFRPYVQLAGGPTLGWVSPYFDDVDGDDRYDEALGEERYDVFEALPKGEPRFGLGGTLALGAYFGRSRKTTQGLRIGYAFTYFFDGVQLLEPGVADAQHFFQTPIISLTFGRLF